MEMKDENIIVPKKDDKDDESVCCSIPGEPCSNITRKVVMLILSIVILVCTVITFVLNQLSNNGNSDLLKEVLDVVVVIANNGNENLT